MRVILRANFQGQMVGAQIIGLLFSTHVFAQEPSVSAMGSYHHDYSYLNVGYLSETEPRSNTDLIAPPFSIANPAQTDLTEPAYYFQFDPGSCSLDPFTPRTDSSQARELANCLREQLWENENIPTWVKATGAAVLVGAGGASGKLDDDLGISIGFDQMDVWLRGWLTDSDE